MTTSAIREKLVGYLKVADDKKLKAIYTLFEDEINSEINDWDESFVQELEQRSKAVKSGTLKTYTWEETKMTAIEKVKSKKK